VDRFVSNFTLRLDSKGRVSIPGWYRSVLARGGFEGLYCYPALDRPAIDAGGSALMAEIESRARKMKLGALFVLTTRTSQWFIERGFHTATVDDLPKQKQALYNYQRKSQVYRKKL